MHRTITAMAAVPVLALIGCGGGAGEAADDAPETSTTTTETTETGTPTIDPDVVEARRAATECRDGLRDLTDELSRVDSRLNIGLTQAEFNTALGDVQVAYDRLRVGRLEQECVLRAAVPLESALNAYIDANNEWADCINDLGCEVEGSVLQSIRAEWSKATRLIRKSSRAIGELRQP